jgi:hypothetical protein
MISPQKNRFENSIRRYLRSSAPALKVRAHSCKIRRNANILAVTELLQVSKPGA